MNLKLMLRNTCSARLLKYQDNFNLTFLLLLSLPLFVILKGSREIKAQTAQVKKTARGRAKNLSGSNYIVRLIVRSMLLHHEILSG